MLTALRQPERVRGPWRRCAIAAARGLALEAAYRCHRARTRRSALRARLADARLYLCTGARRDRGDLAEFADAALAGGVDIVQLRDKGPDGPLEARDELAALEVLARGVRAARGAARGERPRGRRAGRGRGRAAPRAGRPAGGVGAEGGGRRRGRGPLGAQRRRETAGGRRGAGGRLLLRGALLADPDEARTAGAGPRPRAHGGGTGAGAAVVRDRRDRRRTAGRRCWPRGRRAWSSSGRSPRPTTRARRPRRWRPACAPDVVAHGSSMERTRRPVPRTQRRVGRTRRRPGLLPARAGPPRRRRTGRSGPPPRARDRRPASASGSRGRSATASGEALAPERPSSALGSDLAVDRADAGVLGALVAVADSVAFALLVCRGRGTRAAEDRAERRPAGALRRRAARVQRRALHQLDPGDREHAQREDHDGEPRHHQQPAPGTGTTRGDGGGAAATVGAAPVADTAGMTSVGRSPGVT